MPLLDTADPRPVHFVGVAGAGMSGLAELFVRRGVGVTGCDANLGEAGDLRRLGIELREGHDPAHVTDARAVVVTSAVSADHPELRRARELGIPVVRRAEALGEAVAGGRVVAVAGTHGKTTTTTMTTEALEAAGLSPTGITGGRVSAWNGNLRYGGNSLFVVEADEYDRSFLALTPTVAVVTSVEADHLDIYRDFADIVDTFQQFLRPAQVVVRCFDDEGARSLMLPPDAESIAYGVTEPHAKLAEGVSRLVARAVHNTEEGSHFEAWMNGSHLVDVQLRVHGLHNVRNALAALASGISLGAPAAGLAAGLARFAGVQRRFQRVGAAGGIIIIDDYAHHPTEIRATLAAARAAFPGRRIIAAFQPHLYSRTRDFASEFGIELAAADVLLLADIYPAREKPIEGVDSGLIARSARGAGRDPYWMGSRGLLADALAGVVHEGDVVLTMGAGDITRTGGELLQRLTGES